MNLLQGDSKRKSTVVKKPKKNKCRLDTEMCRDTRRQTINNKFNEQET